MWLWRPFFVAFYCALLHVSVCQLNISELDGGNIFNVFRSILNVDCPAGECDTHDLISKETHDHSALEQPVSDSSYGIQFEKHDPSEVRQPRSEDLEFVPEEMHDDSEVLQSESDVDVDISSSNLHFCEQLTSTIEEIELRHPEFKSEKFELLARFRYYLAEYAQFFKEEYPGAPALKFLNLVLAAIEKLKFDYYMELAEEPLLKRKDTEKQVEAETYVSTQAPEEIIAEEETDILSPGFVGSVRGIPGEHYPNYSEVPITSFTCEDKKYIPGFYADLETGCQVFHVCYQHRRESFLCPVGTTFNQPILACDYWYSSNCSLSPLYYDVNAPTEEIAKPESEVEATIGALITSVIEGEKTIPSIEVRTDTKEEQNELASIIKFLPVKAEVVTFPEEPKQVMETQVPVTDVEETASKIVDNLLVTSTHIVGKTRDVVKAIPDLSDTAEIAKHASLAKAAVAVPVLGKTKLAKAKIAAAAAVPFVAKTKLAAAGAAKAKVAAAAVPLVAKTKLAAAGAAKAKVAAAVPLVAKTKLAGAAKAKVAAAAAVPLVAKTKLGAAGAAKAKIAAVPFIAKTKLAAASATKAAATAKAIKLAAAGLPKFKVAKASIPVVKGKMLALPLGKKKFAAATLPFKVKAATKFVPAVKLGAAAKSKLAFIPLKAKMVKAAAISPLTKKALALGYMKLLKAKKLAMMG